MRFFLRLLANWKRPNVRTILSLKIFYSPNSSKFVQNATEIERFLLFVQNLSFYKRKLGYFKENFSVFSKSVKVESLECVSNDIVS